MTLSHPLFDKAMGVLSENGQVIAEQMTRPSGPAICLMPAEEITSVYRLARSFVSAAQIFVHKFYLRKSSSGAEAKQYDCQCVNSLNLETRKPVVKLKVVTLALQRIVTLSDNVIQVLNSVNLQVVSNIKLKNINTFAVSNQAGQGASVEMCTSTKRNKLQIYRLDRTNINLKYEISVPDLLLSLAMDECGVLACSETNYYAYIPPTGNDRRSSGALQTIFTLYDASVPACFTNITSGEYLLNGPNIGITSTLEGTSQRAPLMFIEQPTSFTYSHPYLLALVNDHIHIYSYLDDQLKQEIPLKQCRAFVTLAHETRNTILINSRDAIYLLESLDIEEQIDQLLGSFRLQEALALAESTAASADKQQSNALIVATKTRVGLIEFSAMNVLRALSLFDDVRLDFHEIMLNIPNFLPLKSAWPELDESSRGQYLQWLTAFSDYLNKRSAEFARQPDYYPALLKAYLMTKSREMIVEFLENHASHIPLDFDELLLAAQLYHGTAVLYSAHDKHEQTIDIWKKIVLNEYPGDDTFPGIWIIAKYILERCIGPPLEFAIAKWLLEQEEEELAIKILISKHESEGTDHIFSSDRVIALLKSYPSALRNYLEQAAFKLMIETDEIHTTLVNIYLDQIMSQSQENDESIRSKLQEFLIKSNSYRIQSVLNRVNQTNRLKREVALLYGKMNNFEQAFQILVNELEDFDYAESYCIALSLDKSSEDRKIVAHVLFKIFLAALDKHPEAITVVLFRLLCNNEIEFDFLEVLKRLPSHWPIASIADILMRAVRTCSYTQRSAKLELALNRVQHEKLNVKLTKLKCANVTVNEYRRCKHCLHQFYETSCVVYQDGSQVHVHCAKKMKNL